MEITFAANALKIKSSDEENFWIPILQVEKISTGKIKRNAGEVDFFIQIGDNDCGHKILLSDVTVPNDWYNDQTGLNNALADFAAWLP